MQDRKTILQLLFFHQSTINKNEKNNSFYK